MESKFTGTLWGLIGINVLQFALTTLTLGIAAPWALCIKQRYLVNNTVIDGHRHVFDGMGCELFRKYIVWFLLLVVTLGIYGLWINIKMHRWVTSHIHRL